MPFRAGVGTCRIGGQPMTQFTQPGKLVLQEMIIPSESRCHETKKSDLVHDGKNSIKTVQTHFKFTLFIDAQSTFNFVGYRDL